MLRTFPRLRKIRIRALDQGILVPVSQLLGQTKVPIMIVLFNFDRAFGAVRIVFKKAGNIITSSVEPIYFSRPVRHG